MRRNLPISEDLGKFIQTVIKRKPRGEKKVVGGHEGHRERLKTQFCENGVDGMTEARVLELLLFYAIPMADVYPLAKKLIETFGSLTNVLGASIDELCAVPGVGKNTATLIKLVPQITKKYLVSTAVNIETIRTTDEAGMYLLPLFFGAKVEMAYMLCIDEMGKPIDLQLLAKGDEKSVEINVNEMAEIAAELRAKHVVLAHNHLSNVALTSAADFETTKAVQRALNAVGARLWDHIIVSKNDFVSMSDSGML